MQNIAFAFRIKITPEEDLRFLSSDAQRFLLMVQTKWGPHDGMWV